MALTTHMIYYIHLIQENVILSMARRVLTIPVNGALNRTPSFVALPDAKLHLFQVSR